MKSSGSRIAVRSRIFGDLEENAAHFTEDEVPSALWPDTELAADIHPPTTATELVPTTALSEVLSDTWTHRKVGEEDVDFRYVIHGGAISLKKGREKIESSWEQAEAYIYVKKDKTWYHFSRQIPESKAINASAPPASFSSIEPEQQKPISVPPRPIPKSMPCTSPGPGAAPEGRASAGEWLRYEVLEDEIDHSREVKSISLKKAKEKLEGSWPHNVAFFLDKKTKKWYKFERV